MRVTKLLALASCSMTLGTVISYASGNESAIGIAINMASSSAAIFSIYLLHRISSHLRSSSDTADEFMQGIGRALRYRNSNVPLAGSIRRAADSCAEENAASMLRSAASRISLGQEPSEAISCVSGGNKKISKAIGAGSSQGDFSFGEAFSFHQSEKKESDSRASSLFTRYATINMFLSTVAPSFLMFSVIGSMLISQSNIGTGFMAFGLLIIIPVSYALSNSMLSRRLFG